MTPADLSLQPFFLGTMGGTYQSADGSTAVVALVCVPFVVFEAQQVSVPVKRVRGERALDRVARIETHSARAAVMAAGRKRLGEIAKKASGGSETLASLRLASGLSQDQLARKLGTKQSNISRWEKDPSDLRSATIKRLAAALDVSAERVFAVVLSAPCVDPTDA